MGGHVKSRLPTPAAAAAPRARCVVRFDARPAPRRSRARWPALLRCRQRYPQPVATAAAVAAAAARGRALALAQPAAPAQAAAATPSGPTASAGRVPSRGLRLLWHRRLLRRAQVRADERAGGSGRAQRRGNLHERGALAATTALTTRQDAPAPCAGLAAHAAFATSAPSAPSALAAARGAVRVALRAVSQLPAQERNGRGARVLPRGVVVAARVRGAARGELRDLRAPQLPAATLATSSTTVPAGAALAPPVDPASRATTRAATAALATAALDGRVWDHGHLQGHRAQGARGRRPWPRPRPRHRAASAGLRRLLPAASRLGTVRFRVVRRDMRI